MWLCVTQMCVCPSATTIILKKKKEQTQNKNMDSADDGHSGFL